MISDEQLMLDYKQGDRAAFDTLVRRHWGGMAAFFRRLLHDESQVDDALVECFFRLHKAAATYEPRAQFSTFLFHVAYHQAINTLRANKNWRDGKMVPLLESSELGRHLASEGPDAEAQLLSREQLAVLDALLTTMDETHRAVFQLYYREDLSTVEIAKVLDVPVGSVRAYLCLTRRALREALAESESSHARVSHSGDSHREFQVLRRAKS